MSQRAECLGEGPALFFITALDCSGVGQSPVGGDRLPGPHWTYFVRRVVAYSKYKVHARRAGPCEFIPVLTAKLRCRKTHCSDLFQREPIGLSRRMAAGAEGMETAHAHSGVVQYGLGHETACRVMRTKKEDVVH